MAHTGLIKPFKPNDRVLILPKYSHLYRESSARIIGVIPDHFRSMFNEYTVEFADRSTASIFQFQVIEDLENYKTFNASIIFDSDQQTANAEAGSQASRRRQIILQAPRFHLDMELHKTTLLTSIVGRVLEKSTKNAQKDLDVRLMKEAMPISSVMSDRVGVFKFRHIPPGSLNILVTIHQYFSRILGAFSI
jgi:hypothetical protein